MYVNERWCIWNVGVRICERIQVHVCVRKCTYASATYIPVFSIVHCNFLYINGIVMVFFLYVHSRLVMCMNTTPWTSSSTTLMSDVQPMPDSALRPCVFLARCFSTRSFASNLSMWEAYRNYCRYVFTTIECCSLGKLEGY